MTPIPAACPAEVTFVMEIATAAETESPAFTAKIPMLNETERYPKAIGIPCRTPFQNACLCCTVMMLSFVLSFDVHVAV